MNIISDNVSVDGLRIDEEASRLLDKYKIVTYADLARELENGNMELKRYFVFTQALRDLNHILNCQEQLNHETLENLKEAASSLKHYNSADIDSMVRAVDLPCFKVGRGLFDTFFYLSNDHQRLRKMEEAYKNRFKKYSRYSDYELENYEHAKKHYENYVNNYTVKDVKEILDDTIIVDGQVYPQILFSTNGIGEQKYNTIISSIEFYDRYIKQLLEQYPNIENPFYYMQKEKLSIVREHNVEIFEYLDSVGVEFIFGTMGNLIKLAQDSKGHKINSKMYNKLRNVESVLADYVTMDEALDIENPKVLSKFVLPYGKR